LHSQDDWWRVFVESVTDYAFIRLDREGRITDWNAGAERVLGYTSQEVLGQFFALFFVPEDRAAGLPELEMETALREGRADDERWHLRKDGVRFRASGTLTAVRNGSSEVTGFAKVMRDVTEREKARERMEEALRERTVLLNEVHHRVKNNLQVIVSLLSLQAERLHDPHTLDIFKETQNRVRAIAAIHERLYSTDDLVTIQVGPYIQNLVQDLRDFYDAGDHIDVDLTTADLALDLDDAVPLALICNELLCNAFKHAFPHDLRGKVAIRLRYNSGVEDSSYDEGHLEISDDGVGLPAGVRFETAESMGFELVRLLASQLHGRVVLDSGPQGTSVGIYFPLVKTRDDAR
jgi:PAS domain S-box-containing protein